MSDMPEKQAPSNEARGHWSYDYRESLAVGCSLGQWRIKDELDTGIAFNPKKEFCEAIVTNHNNAIDKSLASCDEEIARLRQEMDYMASQLAAAREALREARCRCEELKNTMERRDSCIYQDLRNTLATIDAALADPCPAAETTAAIYREAVLGTLGLWKEELSPTKHLEVCEICGQPVDDNERLCGPCEKREELK